MANELYSRVPHTGQERGTRPGQNVLEVRFLTAGPPALLQSRLLGTGVRLAATVATMDSSNFPHWLQAVLALSGGVGLFVVAFLDSTFIPFPTVNDLLLITLSIRTPARMPYYAAMVTLGSLAGCLVLFTIARKGGELAFGSRAGIQRRSKPRSFGHLGRSLPE